MRLLLLLLLLLPSLLGRCCCYWGCDDDGGDGRDCRGGNRCAWAAGAGVGAASLLTLETIYPVLQACSLTVLRPLLILKHHGKP